MSRGGRAQSWAGRLRDAPRGVRLGVGLGCCAVAAALFALAVAGGDSDAAPPLPKGWISTDELVAKGEALPCTGPKEPINFEIFSAGPQVAGLPMTSVVRRCDSASPDYEAPSNRITYIYGDCEIPKGPAGDTGCTPPLQVQTWPACQRSGADYSFAGKPIPSRELPRRGGAKVVEYRFLLERRIEVYANSSTVVIFSTDPELGRKAVEQLTPQKAGKPPVRKRAELRRTPPKTLGSPTKGATEGEAAMSVLSVARTRTSLAVLSALAALLAIALSTAPKAAAYAASAAYSTGGDSSCDGSSKTDPVGVLFRGGYASAGKVRKHIRRHSEWDYDVAKSQYLKVLANGLTGEYICKETNESLADEPDFNLNLLHPAAKQRYHTRLWFVKATENKSERMTVGTPHHEEFVPYLKIVNSCKGVTGKGSHAIDEGGINQGKDSGFDMGRHRLKSRFDEAGHPTQPEEWGNTYEKRQCNYNYAGSDGWGVTIRVDNSMSAETRSGHASSGATLSGTLDTEEAATEWWFAYGPLASKGVNGYPYKTEVKTTSQTGEFDVSKAVSVTGPNVVYARLFARNSSGEIEEGNEGVYSTIDVATGDAVDFPAHAAKVTGSVTPTGIPTNYHFEFGTTTAYGGSSQLYGAGSGTSPVAVEGTLNNLAPNTTYHYRIIAENAEGKGIGEDRTFTTPTWPPLITPGSPSEVKAGHGVLNASIDPQGSSTSYHFEWGTEAEWDEESKSFPNVVPIPDEDIGYWPSPEDVSQEITGLKGLTEYFWLIRAANAEGTAESGGSFTTPDWRPVVTTEKQTNVEVVEEEGRATLHGKVNPKGFETAYRFEWGTQAEYEAEEYGHSIPVPDGEAGSGEEDVSVEETIKGIKGQTTYHYRLVAENVEGKSPEPQDRSFTTPDWRPAVGWADAIGERAESATLIARINPEGFATDYHVEWGDQAEYEEGKYENTIEGAALGSGTGWIEVSHELEGLKPRRAYHFRVIAENAEGMSPPQDVTFHTSTSGWVADKYPATLHGAPQGNFTTTFGGLTIGCAGPDLEAALQKTGAEHGEAGAEVLATHPIEKIVCTGTFSISWEMNGCRLEFDPGYGSQGSFEGEFDIGPPGCGPITASTATACPISIPAQVGRAATFTNEGEGSAGTVRVALQANDIRYSVGSGGTICHPQATDVAGGRIEGVWEVSAKDGEGEATGARIDPLFDAGPEVDTEGASDVTTTSATLHGTVDTLGFATYWGFEYGLEPAAEYESVAGGGLIAPGAEGPQAKELTITGLKPSTTYHYRLDGLNGTGSSSGQDRTFTTLGPTGEASDVRLDGATLHGVINPDGKPTTYQFEYGTTAEYGSKAPGTPGEVGSGEEDVEVSEALYGLERGVTYHYRGVSVNEGGTTYGEDKTFTTLHAPRFEAGAYPAQASGEHSGEIIDFGAKSRLECESGQLGGEADEAGSDLWLTPTYAGCTLTNLGAATVDAKSCSYRLHAANTDPPYSGTFAIECAEEEDAILIDGPGCDLEVPAQSTAGTVSYENEGQGASATLAVDLDLEGIEYTTNKKLACTLAGLPAAGEDGSAEGGTTLSAASEEEEVGLAIDGVEDTMGVYVTGEESESEEDRPRFEADDYPALLEGSHSGEILDFGGHVSLNCESGQLAGELSEAGADLSLTPSYGSCALVGLGAATVDAKSCSYRLHAANTDPPYSGTFAIECAEEGDAILIDGPGCDLEVPAQSTAGTVSYENEGQGASATLAVDLDLEGIEYTTNKKLACTAIGLPAAGEDGSAEAELSVGARYPG